VLECAEAVDGDAAPVPVYRVHYTNWNSKYVWALLLEEACLRVVQGMMMGRGRGKRITRRIHEGSRWPNRWRLGGAGSMSGCFRRGS
jgi:hypothetical protein